MFGSLGVLLVVLVEYEGEWLNRSEVCENLLKRSWSLEGVARTAM